MTQRRNSGTAVVIEGAGIKRTLDVEPRGARVCYPSR
jgi:hypothetical protein